MPRTSCAIDGSTAWRSALPSFIHSRPRVAAGRVAALAGLVSLVAPASSSRTRRTARRPSGGAPTSSRTSSRRSPTRSSPHGDSGVSLPHRPQTARPFKRSPSPRCLFVETAGGVSSTSQPQPISPVAVLGCRHQAQGEPRALSREPPSVRLSRDSSAPARSHAGVRPRAHRPGHLRRPGGSRDVSGSGLDRR
jgi:hypothetical protein